LADLVHLISAILIDGLALVRHAVRVLLEARGEVQVLGEGSTAADAVLLAVELRPNVVLLDQNAPGDALQAIRTIKNQVPTIEVVLMGNSLCDGQATRAVEAGASAYIGKDIPAATLITVLKAVCNGDQSPWTYGKPESGPLSFIHNQSRSRAGRNGLTFRELDILAELAYGNTDHEIATKLLVGEGTVKTHIRHILSKLGARNRTEAIATALRRHMIQ
jgi:DNA-binding NarL/FixJ family response regulator